MQGAAAGCHNLHLSGRCLEQASATPVHFAQCCYQVPPGTLLLDRLTVTRKNEQHICIDARLPLNVGTQTEQEHLRVWLDAP